MLVADSYKRDFGVAFRVQSWSSGGSYFGSGYLCRVNTRSSSSAYMDILFVAGGDVDVEATSGTFSFSADAFNYVKATAVGSSLTCAAYSADGATLLASTSWTDSTYSYGGVGTWNVRDDKGSHYVQYLTVESL